jgi:endonuclease-3
MIAAKVGRLFALLAEKYPTNGPTELNYKNPYNLLVAVILSARSTDAGVNRATAELFRVVDNPEDMVNLGIEKLREYIKTVNYYNTKAKHIISMSEKLLRDFAGKVPDNLESLLSLDGVGRKSANIILNIVFGLPRVAVDTHVFRVGNRLGLIKANNVLMAEKQLMKVVPKKHIGQINSLLVPFGRYICRALRPKCDICALSGLCDFSQKKKMEPKE